MKKQLLASFVLLMGSGLASADITITVIFPGSFSPVAASTYSREILRNFPESFRSRIKTGEVKVSYKLSPTNLAFTFTTPSPTPPTPPRGPQIWLGASRNGDMSGSCSCWDESAKQGRGDNICRARGHTQGLCGNRKELYQGTSPMVVTCTKPDQWNCYSSTISVDTAAGTMTIQSDGQPPMTIRCLRHTYGYGLYGSHPSDTSKLYWLGPDNRSSQLKPIQCNIP